jgi:endonuclease/exonuclease/phosphatase family metal-dependent hydrolase
MLSPVTLPEQPVHISADRPSPHIVMPLRHHATGVPIVFACTHLKAKGSDEFEAIRAGQIGVVLEGVQAVSLRVQSSDSNNGDAQCRCVVMGDFNAEACESSGGTRPMAVPTALSWCDGALSSAYPLPVSQDEDLYSTWKTRGGKQSKRVIDYILYTRGRGLEVTSLLQVPAAEEIADSPCKLPDLRYPSDHIAIAADLNIVI